MSREVVHCDETPVQVLKEDGKKPQTKSYMWLYRTGNDGKPPVILYDYQPSRNGDHAVTYLKDFKGYVHSDGYSGYNKLDGITRCGCWAHLRRKFVEAIPSKKAEGSPPTAAETGRDYCDRLFHLEETLKALSPEERKIKRLELEKPVLDAFWCWFDTLEPLKGSALDKAVTYARKQNHTWKTICWTADALFPTMQPRMPFVRSRSEERTGCLPTRQRVPMHPLWFTASWKPLKPTESMFMRIFSICSSTWPMVTGTPSQASWTC